MLSFEFWAKLAMRRMFFAVVIFETAAEIGAKLAMCRNAYAVVIASVEFGLNWLFAEMYYYKLSSLSGIGHAPTCSSTVAFSHLSRRCDETCLVEGVGTNLRDLQMSADFSCFCS